MKIGKSFSSIALMSLCVAALVPHLAAQTVTANPSTISLSAPANSTATVSQNLTLTVNGGSGQLLTVNTGGITSLRVVIATVPACTSPVAGCNIINPPNSISVTVQANPTSVAQGTYSGAVNLQFSGQAGVQIPVTFTVGTGTGGGSSVLVPSPSSLSFPALPGVVAQSQVVTIGNTGNAINYTASSNVSWLSTSIGSGQGVAPGSLTVTASAVNLPAGSYAGTLTLTPTGGGQSSTVSVTLVVSSAQQFQINPSALSFNYITGSGSNSSTPLQIGVTTGNPVTYNVGISYNQSSGWLSTNPVTTGTTGTSSSPTSVTVTTIGGSLGVGTYTANLTFSANGLASVIVPVTLVVSSPPTFVVSPNPVTIFVPLNGNASRALSLNTSSGASVNYSVAANPAVSWLTLSNASGNTPNSVTLGVNAGSLAAGNYTTVLQISSTTPGVISTSVNFTMTVTTGQIVSANASALSFSFVGGGSPAPTQFVSLTLNPSTPIQTATVGAVPDVAGQTWLSASLQPTSQITGNAAVAVNVNPVNLGNGTYTGRIQINISNANGAVANQLIEIPVSLTVSGVVGGGGGSGGTPTLLFSQNPINFNLAGTSQTDQSLVLTPTSGAGSTYSLSTSTSWLTIFNGSGNLPNTATIRASSNNLNPGTYTGSITVSAPGATNSSSTIQVNLTVSSSNQLQTTPSGMSFLFATGGVGPSSQTLNVASTLPANVLAVTATATSTNGWLTITPGSANTSGTFVVSINSSIAQNLGPGTYNGNIALQAPNALNPTVNVPIVLTVTGTGTGGGGGSTTGDLVFGPSSMRFFVNLGSATAQNLEIGTTTGNSIPYSISATSTGNWLSVNPSSGSAPGQVTVTANSSGLVAGTYTGNLTILASTAVNTTNSNIQVTLVVSPNGTANLVTTPFGGAVFTVAPGTTTIQTRQIQVGTTNFVSVPISVTTDSTTGALTVSTNSNTTPATITISLNPSAFGTGTYPGIVFINSTGAGNSRLELPITLIVTGTNVGISQLSLNPNTLSFFGQPGGTPPAQSTVSVTSNGPAISYSVSANQPWLIAGPSSGGTTPGTLTIGVNPSNLTAGNYTGQVTVTGGGSTVNLPVTFTVTTNPLVQLSQQSVTFNLQTGQPLPAPRPILVTTSNGSSQGASVSVSSTTGGNWLVASPINLQTPGIFALSLASNVASTLNPGTYNATVTVNVPGATNANSQINVTLNVSASALLTMSTTPIGFNAQFNGSAPPSQSRQIAATSGQLNVTVSTSTGTGAWLSANITSNTTPASLNISASPAGLGTGVYTGSVTVTSGNQSSALVIPITLTVSSLPLISVDRSELVFGGGGTGGTAAQSLQINSSSNNFTYSVNASVTSSPTNWLSVSNFNGVTPSILQVTANPALLNDGTYFGTIVITASGVGNTPLVIPVTLTVNQSTALVVNPTTISFTQAQGGSAPAQQPVQVTSQVPTTFSPTTTVNSPVGGNWLTVSQSTGVTNGFLQVSINNTAAALPAGVYTGTVTVSGPNSPNTPTIAVTLTVTPAASLQIVPTSLSFAGRVGQANPPVQLVQLSSSNPNATQVAYNVQSDATWLTATPVTGSTPSTLSVAVNVAGLAAGNFTGRLTITPTGSLSGVQATVITVNLAMEQVPIPNVTGFANAATFTPGSLAPGMIISLVGSNLGPITAVNGQVVGGRFTTSVAGVRVLFDGVPAPILYASSTQINAVVPYSLAGRASTRMSVEFNNILSNTIEPRLVDTNPGIFTTDGRQAAMFNENGTFNGPANPAAAGSIVVIYVTGEGATSPGGVDGEVIGTNLKRPVGAVRVRVGGIEVPAASIFYAGSAPSLVSGLMQLNFLLPMNTPTGVGTSLEVFVGSGQSQPGVVLSVR